MHQQKSFFEHFPASIRTPSEISNFLLPVQSFIFRYRDSTPLIFSNKFRIHKIRKRGARSDASPASAMPCALRPPPALAQHPRLRNSKLKLFVHAWTWTVRLSRWAACCQWVGVVRTDRLLTLHLMMPTHFFTRRPPIVLYTRLRAGSRLDYKKL